MFQVRIHGRGGQGAVTAAELLSVAAFLGGRHAQAFPSFGSERSGAPVMAFCRIDSPCGADDLGLQTLTGPVLTVPTTALALRHVGRPVPSAVLLGGLFAE
ncbi:2-oxoacid:acceptor oxidoreductase family protein [Streptomyces sp. NPDC087859]|uniref:2-oxoacid:acceptor oxidoreductase family protein n=1 Tax=Streptomyces sp. NPDC087859 TaxID=3365812 RepID=UPI003820FDDD